MGIVSEQEVEDLKGRSTELITVGDIDAAKQSADDKAALANALLGAGAAVTLVGAVLALPSAGQEEAKTSWRVSPGPEGGFARWTLAW